MLTRDTQEKIATSPMLATPRFHQIAFLVFLGVVLSIASIFILSQLLHAHQKDLWTDETWTLGFTLQRTYDDLIIKGGKGQISPAPLDFLVTKLIDQIKEWVQYFSLPANVYFRLDTCSTVGYFFVFERNRARAATTFCAPVPAVFNDLCSVCLLLC